MFDAKISGLYFSKASFALTALCPVKSVTKDNIVDFRDNDCLAMQEIVTRETKHIHQKLNKVFAQNVELPWERFEGNDAQDLIANCLFHDLVILSSPLNISNLLEHLNSAIVSIASESGCPVCVIPTGYEGELNINDPIIVWNDSRATARAIADALPFLQQANSVTIYCDYRCRKTNNSRLKSLKKLTEYLKLHGVTEHTLVPSKSISNFSDDLLQHINTNHHDLVIIGAYDRTKVKELVIGNTTRIVLQQVKVPVLLSH